MAFMKTFFGVDIPETGMTLLFLLRRQESA
jgi:hypothetical protein